MGEIIRLGLVAGRHEMPVEGYVLESVPDVTDIKGIREAVFKSLAQKLGEFIRVSDFGTCLNQSDYSDVPHAVCDAELHLYVTGLTSVALEVVRFCAFNGVKLVAYHFDRETGKYIPQQIFSGCI